MSGFDQAGDRALLPAPAAGGDGDETLLPGPAAGGEVDQALLTGAAAGGDGDQVLLSGAAAGGDGDSLIHSDMMSQHDIHGNYHNHDHHDHSPDGHGGITTLWGEAHEETHGYVWDPADFTVDTVRRMARQQPEALPGCVQHLLELGSATVHRCVDALDAFAVHALLLAGAPLDLPLPETGESYMIVAMQTARHDSCLMADVRPDPVTLNRRDRALSQPVPAVAMATHPGTVSPLLMMQVLQAHGCVSACPDDYEDQVSPLHWAVRAGCYPCALHLIRSSHPVDCLASDGCTPIMHAAYFGRIECVRLLAGWGARMDTCSAADAWTLQHGNAGLTVHGYAAGSFLCGSEDCYCHEQLLMLDHSGKAKCCRFLLKADRRPCLQALCRHELRRGVLLGKLAPPVAWGLPGSLERYLLHQ